MGTHLPLRPEEVEKGKTERLPRPEETGINRMSAAAGRNGKRVTGAPRIPNGNGRNGFREKDREREKKRRSASPEKLRKELRPGF